MLERSRKRILQSLSTDAIVLDIGGWAKPFPRADWVLDLFPYETRGAGGTDGEGPERFAAATWIERDVCDREPYPFADGQFDFVICSHTLEDVRDPLFVCAEMVRIAKAGYVEVPSRLEEQAYGFQGPWVGWGHHRWLIDVGEDSIEFVHKHGVVHGREGDHFPPGFQAGLSAEERVQTLWWQESFDFRERIFVEPAELDAHLAGFVARELQARGRPAPSAEDGRASRLARRLGLRRASG